MKRIEIKGKIKIPLIAVNGILASFFINSSDILLYPVTNYNIFFFKNQCYNKMLLNFPPFNILYRR